MDTQLNASPDNVKASARTPGSIPGRAGDPPNPNRARRRLPRHQRRTGPATSTAGSTR